MRNITTVGLLAALTTVLGCTKTEEAPLDTARLFASRDQINVAYAANLWGELIECG